MAMSILVRMAEVKGARSLLDITRAHIDSTIYVGEAGLEFAEKLAALGGRVAVPSTLNVSGLDEYHWREWSVPDDWANKAHRQMVAYQTMGTIPTWTCAPYQTEHLPKRGEQIAWGESNAVAFANSVIGARTERYPDLLDICAALTARAPAAGLHLTENRRAQLVLKLSGLPASLVRRSDFYPVLGYLVGTLAGEQVPAIVGLQHGPTEDQLKALGAAAASSGGVGLFHVVGVTPEAPTLDEALQGKPAERILDVTFEQLRRGRAELSTLGDDGLDLVVLGSPHFSIEELRELAPLLEGRQRHSDVEFLVTTSRGVRDIAQAAGLLDSLEAFGGRITVDTCILATPMLPRNVTRIMTNSGKYAHYAPGLLDVSVAFGSLEDCVASAEAGRVVRAQSEWDA
jgi:predicted aconitase